MQNELIGLVPAAGIGARALAPSAGDAALPKQYRRLAGQAMLRLAVQALLREPRITRVIVAVAPGDDMAASVLGGLPRVQVRACGGATRADTVRAALLQAACAEQDWVLVHDAARPGLPAEALARLIDACQSHDSAGLLALPVADTVKRAASGPNAVVGQTIDRDGLWLAQTPQMARAGALLQALQADHASGVAPTDESAALERAGHAPLLVRGDARNFKVTWPEDFTLMEKWL